MPPHSSADVRNVLATVLSAALGDERVRELAASVAARPLSEQQALAALARAGRKLGPGEHALSEAEQRALRALGYAAAERVPLAQLARVLLLLEACDAFDGHAQLALLTRAYRTSSNDERVALLRALPLLPEPARFLAIATDACRSHVLDVFQAIACDNPYPARHFDQASFNQLVVKALFVGAPLARLEGLAARGNPELLRMVRDYVAERRAAGRSVPSDVTLIDPELRP